MGLLAGFAWGVGTYLAHLAITKVESYAFSDDTADITTSTSAVTAINTLSNKVEDLTDRINTIVGVSSNT
jgi:formyltetrahydrofolate synthetase